MRPRGMTQPQLYRARGDAENASDELKKQLGLGGFVTEGLMRTAIMARLNEQEHGRCHHKMVTLR